MRGNSLPWGSGSSVRSFGTSLCRACSPLELAGLCECVPTACPRAQTLPLPYNPFSPDPGELLEGPDLYLAWGRMAGSGLYSGWVARAPQSCGAPVLLLPRREPGLGSPPCPGSSPARLCHRQHFLTGIPPLGAASATFCRNNVPSSPSERDGYLQPRTHQRSRSPKSSLSPFRHKSLIIFNN